LKHSATPWIRCIQLPVFPPPEYLCKPPTIARDFGEIAVADNRSTIVPIFFGSPAAADVASTPNRRRHRKRRAALASLDAIAGA
jgi:hypothetical protein